VNGLNTAINSVTSPIRLPPKKEFGSLKAGHLLLKTEPMELTKGDNFASVFPMAADVIAFGARFGAEDGKCNVEYRTMNVE
jgi:hypothetical protein